MNSRERFIAAIHRRPTDRRPLWFMRQAGRYLPEYRKLKQQYTFPHLVKTPELATEVTLQPLRRFPLDAAILFSDILVIPEALGQPYRFHETQGIEMTFTLDSPRKVAALDPGRIEEQLDYVPQALRLLRKELGKKKALLGFCGSPWTLAAYMIEGKSSPHFEKTKTFVFEHPKTFEKLLEKLTQALMTYLRMQIAAGADAIQIFDSWANACAGHCYQSLSLRWIQKIITALPSEFPVILFAKGMAHHAKALKETGAKVLSLDWTVRLSELLSQVGGNIALQGNLDPSLLNTQGDIVRAQTRKVLEDMAHHHGHIFNLGHGILPNAKLECVEAMVETVRTFEYPSPREVNENH